MPAMSYALHVWEGPEPVNRANVAQVLDWLRHDRCAPNPRLIEFARRLMVRYPHDADDASGHGVWTDGVVDGRCDTPVLVLGVASPLPSVLRFVAETAMILGLHVHDPQARRTWFASGTVHPPYSAAELAQPRAAERPTYPELKRSINEALYRILEKDGFFLEKGGGRLVRRIAGGTQGVHITVLNHATEWECSLGFYWDFDLVEDIQYLLFDNEAVVARASRHTGWLSLSELPGGKRFRVKAAADARRAILEQQSVIVQGALPVLDARTTLRDFVECHLSGAALPLDVFDHALAIRLLIAARLARSPRFGPLVLQLAQAWKEEEDIRVGLVRLLQYLRSVDPDHVVLPDSFHERRAVRADAPAGERRQAFGSNFAVDVDNGENTTFGILHGDLFEKR
jgi:hypothetical protein